MMKSFIANHQITLKNVNELLYIARDKYKRLLEDVADGKISDEQAFMRRTKSIRPYIANVYGWTNYGKMVKIS